MKFKVTYLFRSSIYVKDNGIKYIFYHISCESSMVFSNHYNVIAIIGEGAFSRVHKVENTFSGIKFAEKRLKQLFNNKTEVHECLEIQLLKHLKYHENVVQIVDIICDPFPGYVHLIFELMDMSLYDFIKSQKYLLIEKKVKNILYQLVCAVAHLHKSNMFHRDIKPENILLKMSANNKLQKGIEIVKLADLGSARYLKKNEESYTAYIATRWYRPPECILTTGNYDNKIDIWAIGCIFFELLALKPLFPGDNDLDQLYKIHEITGSPSARLLGKFKNKIIHCQFPVRKSLCFSELLPDLNNVGQELLQGCLMYDPNVRLNIKQLKYNKYFISIKKKNELGCSSNLSHISLTKPKREIELKDKNGKVTGFKSKTTVALDCSSTDLWKMSIKERERAWGMNAGPAKDILLSRSRLKL